MSNIYKPIYGWNPLDETNPMVCILGQTDKVMEDPKVIKCSNIFCIPCFFDFFYQYTTIYAKDHIHILYSCSSISQGQLVPQPS